MKPRLRISRRSRLRLVLLATCALLLQHVALIAHACAPARTAMTAHCAEMAMPVTDAGQAATCAFHCTSQTPTAPEARTPTVPPLALAVLPSSAPTSPTLATSAVPPAFCVAPHSSPPAARILHCTLQL